MQRSELARADRLEELAGDRTSVGLRFSDRLPTLLGEFEDRDPAIAVDGVRDT